MSVKQSMKQPEPAAAESQAEQLAPETIRLAEENRRLSRENRELRQAEREREVALFLSELRDGGQLTPALEQAGVEQALLASEDAPVLVSFPDGRTLPLAAVLREVLASLPVSYIGKALAAASPAAHPALSEQERSIASQLGLTEEEYASIKAGE